MTDSFPKWCEILQKRKVRIKFRADHFNMRTERQRTRVKSKVCERVKWLVTPGAYLLFQQHEATRSISTSSLHPPPPLDRLLASPPQGYISGIKFVSTHLYTSYSFIHHKCTSWVEISTVKVKWLAECFPPGLDHEPGIQFDGFFALAFMFVRNLSGKVTWSYTNLCKNSNSVSISTSWLFSFSR